MLIRQSCVLAESTVSAGAKIGPFAHLRPGSEIGEEAHIGNFVETKKTKVGKGAKASHLTYLGDAEVGEGTNIGAGVITCNYDGVNKHRTHIGKDVFVGSDSTLVAPVLDRRWSISSEQDLVSPAMCRPAHWQSAAPGKLPRKVGLRFEKPGDSAIEARRLQQGQLKVVWDRFRNWNYNFSGEYGDRSRPDSYGQPSIDEINPWKTKGAK